VYVIAADMHYETGYAKLSSKANSIKRANTDAKEKIAQWINTTVQNVIVNYTSDFGEGDNRQALEAFESISRLTSEASLMGVTQESVWMDSQGGVWVLCSMPIENTLKAFESAANQVSKSFGTNEAALYAENKMNDALAKLDATLKNQ
jgi:replication-associated recombination protein RarA